MEGGEGLKKNVASHEVVVVIPGTEENSRTSKRSEESKESEASESASHSSSDHIRGKPPNIEVKKQENYISTIQMSTSSPGNTNLSPGQNRPPKPPTETSFRRRSLASSAYAKPKSRLLESPYNRTMKLVEDNAKVIPASSPYRNSPNIVSPSSKTSTPRESGRKTSAPITPRTPLMSSGGGEDDEDEDDDEVYMTGRLRVDEKKHGKNIKVMILIEWFAFVCILSVLITNLTINKFSKAHIWGLEIWKWCVLVLVICCGRLVTGWISNLLAFLIERNFLLKKKVLYFLYGLRSSVRVFVWLGLILLAWGLLINRGVERSTETQKTLNKITRGIACTLMGAALWMVKTFLIKLLASSFHVKKFFDRIQESIFHQYVLQTLSGPPLMECERKTGNSRTSGQLSVVNSVKKGKQKEKGEEVIDVDKLYRINREKVSAWTMSGLIKVIRSSGLSTIAGALDEIDYDEGEKKEITSEMEAKAEAKRIFKNVAKPGNKYVERKDLLRFMPKEEVDIVLPLFEGTVETGQIKKSSFKNWVIFVYNERKCLAHSLNDTKTAIEELNRIASVLVLVTIVILWILLMGITTTEVMVFISSQLLVLAFMFGNTFKTVFEGIIFNFVVHPFDVGDRCVINGMEMVVEEMDLMTTIFLRQNNEKIYYPNSVLASIPISNFNRSPEMADSVEFAVDFSTSVESIAALKDKIKAYLESKPQHWRPNHSVIIKEIEDVNKMNMALSVTHTMNFQNSSERQNRRSDLVFELKKIFEELGIKYRLPPQEVLISYAGSVPPTSANIVQ